MTDQTIKTKKARKPVFPKLDYLSTKADEMIYIRELQKAVQGSYLASFISDGAISWFDQKATEDHSTDLYRALNEAHAMISELRAHVHNVSLELRQAREDALRLATADNEKRLKLDEFERELDITKAQARYAAEHNAELLQRNQELTDSWNEMHQAQSGLEKTIQERDIDILCKDAEICRLKALLWDMSQAK